MTNARRAAAMRAAADRPTAEAPGAVGAVRVGKVKTTVEMDPTAHTGLWTFIGSCRRVLGPRVALAHVVRALVDELAAETDEGAALRDRVIVRMKGRA